MPVKWKPGASIRTHHYLAAAIWSIVGLSLLVRGGSYLLTAGKVWLVLPAILLGTIKSLFILDKSARKNLTRFVRMQDGACIGGVYSSKMWLLVVAMIVMGRLLRMSDLPLEFIGIFYSAIGWALFFSSRIIWERAKQLAPHYPSAHDDHA